MRYVYAFLIIALQQTVVAQVSVQYSADHWSLDTVLAAPNPNPFAWDEYRGEVKNKLRRNRYVYDPIPEKSNDVLQSEQGNQFNADPALKWDGIDFNSQQVAPPDPSIGVGENHVVQMVNTAMQVWDKAGNVLLAPTALSDIFPGSSNDGDPIVLYDKFESRWFISQFQQDNNQILIGVSQTDNPLAGWEFYSFSFDEFPDYPKYSIWGDGYYMTANTTVQNMVVFERDSMLIGSQNARMIAMDFPGLRTNGFFSALPLNCWANDIADCQGSNFAFYFEDDGWTGEDDILKSWKIDIDWLVPSNSTIVEHQEIPVADFDSEFTFSWDDIEQPGTDSRLDAIPGALMYMANVYPVAGKQTILLSHTIDVDPSSDMRGAIRWYDLTLENGSWGIQQQGTYAPEDGKSRFIPSMAKDINNNVGMAFSISGPSTFPSIAYTGRYAEDELGKMTLEEKTAFSGSDVQVNTNRFGDYAHMVNDPNDASLFWFTGEYLHLDGWKTGIFSFKIPPKNQYDVAVVDLERPNSGLLADTNEIAVSVRNNGTDTVVDFWVVVDAAGERDSVFVNDSLAPNQSVFVSGFANRLLSTPGDYDFLVYTNYGLDELLVNDTLSKVIRSFPEADVVLDRLTAPIEGFDLGVEQISIALSNQGTDTIYNIPIHYEIDGNLVTESIDTLLPAVNTIYSFNQTADFSTVGTYTLTFYSAFVSDFDLTNDTIISIIEKPQCTPVGDCDFGDEINSFSINGLTNTSLCGDDGYQDHTGFAFSLQEENNQMEITSSSDGDVLSIWVDWDSDQFFEEDELWVQNYSFDFDTIFTIDIPENANTGQFLMRVRIAYMEPSDNPCNEVFFGETEDYTVNYSLTGIDVQSTEQIMWFSQSAKSMNFSKTGGRLILYNSAGQMVSNDVVETSQKSVNELQSGVYFAKYYYQNQTFSLKITLP